MRKKEQPISIFKKFKQSNFKAFLFFLCMSFVVWILVQFAKPYKQTLDFDIRYTNIPKDKLVENNDNSLKVTIETTGFRLISYTFFKPYIDINLSNLEIASNEFIFDINENKEFIAKELKISEDVISLKKESINIPFSQKTVKILPVNIAHNIKYAVGFSNVSDFKTNPDSIKVSGPKSVLDTLEVINTEEVKYDNVNNSITGEVTVNQAKYKDVTFYETKISYEIEVAKFTEGRVKVPIEIINVPNNVSVSIFPKEVYVVYQASLENFNFISSEDFRVVKDFKELKSESDYFIPKLYKTSQLSTESRVLDTKVEFIIKQ